MLVQQSCEILGFFDGFELLEPGLVPQHQWRSVAGQAATGTPNIQWGAVGHKRPGWRARAQARGIALLAPRRWHAHSWATAARCCLNG